MRLSEIPNFCRSAGRNWHGSSMPVARSMIQRPLSYRQAEEVRRLADSLGGFIVTIDFERDHRAKQARHLIGRKFMIRMTLQTWI